MHSGHLTRSSFRPLFVACEIIFDVTMQACNTERAAISNVHDQQQPARRGGFEDLNVLEDLLSRLALSSADDPLDLGDIAIV